MDRPAPPRGFAPLWVYFFGLFAVAVLQRWLFPPASTAWPFNVTVFVVGEWSSSSLTSTALQRTVDR